MSGATAATIAVQRLVVGVDAERDDLGAAARPRGQARGLVEADEARALGEKHEADHVGAGGERRFQRRARSTGRRF